MRLPHLHAGAALAALAGLSVEATAQPRASSSAAERPAASCPVPLGWSAVQFGGPDDPYDGNVIVNGVAVLPDGGLRWNRSPLEREMLGRFLQISSQMTPRPILVLWPEDGAGCADVAATAAFVASRFPCTLQTCRLAAPPRRDTTRPPPRRRTRRRRRESSGSSSMAPGAAKTSARARTGPSLQSQCRENGGEDGQQHDHRSQSEQPLPDRPSGGPGHPERQAAPRVLVDHLVPALRSGTLAAVRPGTVLVAGPARNSVSPTGSADYVVYEPGLIGQ